MTTAWIRTGVPRLSASYEYDRHGAADRYDPVGCGYALDDPKHPDAGRWS